MRYRWKIFVVAIILIQLHLSARSQSRMFPSDLPDKVQLELTHQPLGMMMLPVREIEILDARFDRSVIGTTTGEYMLVEDKFSKKDIVFSGTLKLYLDEKLNSWFRFESNSSKRLLILIKKFRTNENVARMLLKNKKKEVLFLLSASFYLQEGEKCTRIATAENWHSSDFLDLNHYRTRKDLHEWVITNVLIEALQKLSFVVPQGALAYQRQELENGILQRMSFPILQTKIKKGVYRSFTEFIRNHPSDTSYGMGLDRKKNLVFVDSAGRRLTSANTWGISDGASTVFMFGENFY